MEDKVLAQENQAAQTRLPSVSWSNKSKPVFQISITAPLDRISSDLCENYCGALPAFTTAQLRLDVLTFLNVAAMSSSSVKHLSNRPTHIMNSPPSGLQDLANLSIKQHNTPCYVEQRAGLQIVQFSTGEHHVLSMLLLPNSTFD